MFEERPQILLKAYDVETVEGRSLRLHCFTAAFPVAKVNWTQNEVQVKGDYPVSRGFYIRSAVSSQSGDYRCIAYNSIGTAISDVTKVLVISKFVFTLLTVFWRLFLGLLWWVFRMLFFPHWLTRTMRNAREHQTLSFCPGLVSAHRSGDLFLVLPLSPCLPFSFFLWNIFPRSLKKVKNISSSSNTTRDATLYQINFTSKPAGTKKWKEQRYRCEKTHQTLLRVLIVIVYTELANWSPLSISPSRSLFRSSLEAVRFSVDFNLTN